MEAADGNLLALLAPHFGLFDDLRQEAEGDTTLGSLRLQIVVSQLSSPWSFSDDLVLFYGHVRVPVSSPSLQLVLSLAHDSKHEGVHKTSHRLKADFHIPRMHATMQIFVQPCAVCQQNKSEQLHPAGLLQPLEVPSHVWSNISMDFVEGLPKVNRKYVILTVVDCFSSTRTLFPCPILIQLVSSVARIFFDEIVCLHGFPNSIVSDRDNIFTSNFWTYLY